MAKVLVRSMRLRSLVWLILHRQWARAVSVATAISLCQSLQRVASLTALLEMGRKAPVDHKSTPTVERGSGGKLVQQSGRGRGAKRATLSKKALAEHDAEALDMGDEAGRFGTGSDAGAAEPKHKSRKRKLAAHVCLRCKEPCGKLSLDRGGELVNIDNACEACYMTWLDGFSYADFEAVCEECDKSEESAKRFDLAMQVRAKQQVPAFWPQEVRDGARVGQRTGRRFQSLTIAEFEEEFGFKPQALNIKPQLLRDEFGERFMGVLLLGLPDPLQQRRYTELFSEDCLCRDEFECPQDKVIHDEQAKKKHSRPRWQKNEQESRNDLCMSTRSSFALSAKNLLRTTWLTIPMTLMMLATMRLALSFLWGLA